MIRKITLLFFLLLSFYSSAQNKSIFGEYQLLRFSCCFGWNCAQLDRLTLYSDSSYSTESFSYSSPIKGKYWIYTLNAYEKTGRNHWEVENDTLLIPYDHVFNFPIVVKNGELFTGLEFYPGDKEKSSLDKLEKYNPPLFRSKKIKKHMRHRRKVSAAKMVKQ